MKICPTCKGEGYVMPDETPEDCGNCDGAGEVEDDLFEEMARIARIHNKILLEIYSPFQF